MTLKDLAKSVQFLLKIGARDLMLLPLEVLEELQQEALGKLDGERRRVAEKAKNLLRDAQGR